MIIYIHARLCAWGIWSHMRIDGDFTPRRAQFDYEEHIPGISLDGAEADPPSDSECIEMEEGVGWLSGFSRKLGNCVRLHYRDHPDWSACQQATILVVSESTLYAWIHDAHKHLLGYLNDRAAGVIRQVKVLMMS